MKLENVIWLLAAWVFLLFALPVVGVVLAVLACLKIMGWVWPAACLSISAFQWLVNAYYDGTGRKINL